MLLLIRHLIAIRTKVRDLNLMRTTYSVKYITFNALITYICGKNYQILMIEHKKHFISTDQDEISLAADCSVLC